MKALEVSRSELLREQRNQKFQQNNSAETCTDKVTSDDLAADALVRMAERALSEKAEAASSSDHFQVLVHVDAEVLANPTTPGRCEVEGGPEVSAETDYPVSCADKVDYDWAVEDLWRAKWEGAKNDWEQPPLQQ